MEKQNHLRTLVEGGRVGTNRKDDTIDVKDITEPPTF